MVNTPVHFGPLLEDLSLLNYPNLPFAISILTGFTIGFSLNPRMHKASLTRSPSTPELDEIINAAHAKAILRGEASLTDKNILADLPLFSLPPQFTVPNKDSHRVITDFKTSGLNSTLNTSMFGPLVMDRIPALLAAINSFHPSTDLMLGAEDCQAYFRQFPLLVPERAFAMVSSHLQELGILVDHRLSFGSSTAPFITHHLLDLVCYVLFHKFKTLAFHYSDNLFYLSRSSLASQTQKVIKQYLTLLGLATNPHDSFLAREIPLLGFTINCISRFVSISSEKRQILCDACTPRSSIPYAELRTLVGKLIWLCQIVPLGMSHAVGLWTLLDETSKRIVILNAPARASLLWFHQLLKQWDGFHFFNPSRFLESRLAASTEPIDMAFASDASPLGGCFLTKTHYSAFNWCCCCWEACGGDISILETATFLSALASGIGTHLNLSILTWYTDSESSTKALLKGYSANPLMNALIQELLQAMTIFHCHINPIWKPRSSLSLADSYTRGGIVAVLPPLPDGRLFLRALPSQSLTLVNPFTLGFSIRHPNPPGKCSPNLPT
jgi:hypothetical protein